MVNLTAIPIHSKKFRSYVPDDNSIKNRTMVMDVRYVNEAKKSDLPRPHTENYQRMKADIEKVVSGCIRDMRRLLIIRRYNSFLL